MPCSSLRGRRPGFFRGLALALLLAAGVPAAGGLRAEPMITLRNPALQPNVAEVRLEPEQLAAMTQVTIRTSNEFVDGVAEFRGPLARDVVAQIGRGTAQVGRFVAANDYSVEIDLAEFDRYDVIFATHMNGKPLSRRDKGPVWVIYPMDQHPELKDPAWNNRLIWQLVRVELK